jgi:hypothetical protein
MRRPTIEELQTFWLLVYSRASLLEANALLKAMEIAKPESIELRAIIDAAVIAYARPFNKFQVTRERRVAPLADISPPTHLAEFHQDALDLRNKLIGHKDATPAQRHTTTPNVVLVHINSKGFNLHTTIIGEMETPMRNALKELCAYFVKHCEKNLRPLTKGYFSEVMKHSPGVYEFVISEPPADWIRPFRPN